MKLYGLIREYEPGDPEYIDYEALDRQTTALLGEPAQEPQPREIDRTFAPEPEITVGDELAAGRLAIDLSVTSPAEVARLVQEAISGGPKPLNLVRAAGSWYKRQRGRLVPVCHGDAIRLIQTRVLLYHSRPDA